MDICPVCLEDLDEESDIITTKCNHKFHKECLNKWQEDNSSCPMCRSDILNEYIINEFIVKHPLYFRKKTMKISNKNIEFKRGDKILTSIPLNNIKSVSLKEFKCLFYKKSYLQLIKYNRITKKCQNIYLLENQDAIFEILSDLFQG